MIDLIGIFKITDLIDIALSILNVILVDPAVFLWSWMEVSSCCKVFSWLMPSVDRVEIPNLMSNPSNLISLYYKSVNELKM